MAHQAGLKLLGGLLILGICLIMAAAYAQIGAVVEVGTIAIKVTPGYVSIVANPHEFDFGLVKYGACAEATKTTGTGICYKATAGVSPAVCQIINTTISTTTRNGCFIANNSGNVDMLMYMNVTNTTDWFVATAPTANHYQINISIGNITHVITSNNTTLTGWWNVSDALATAGVGAYIVPSQNVTWDMRFWAPTTSSVTTAQTFRNWVRGMAA